MNPRTVVSIIKQVKDELKVSERRLESLANKIETGRARATESTGTKHLIENMLHSFAETFVNKIDFEDYHEAVDRMEVYFRAMLERTEDIVSMFAQSEVRPLDPLPGEGRGEAFTGMYGDVNLLVRAALLIEGAELEDPKDFYVRTMVFNISKAFLEVHGDVPPDPNASIENEIED